MRRVVNAHPSIACPPETFYMNYFAKMIDDSEVRAGLFGVGCDDEKIDLEVGKWASRYHEAFRSLSNKPRWADKTPQYTSILPQLNRMYRDVQFIFIYRHPLDVLYSQYKRGWKFGEYSEDLLENNAIYIAESIKKMAEFKLRFPDRVHEVFYEQLVERPEEVLRGMFGFLGEPWCEEVLEYHKKDHGFGTEDPVVKGMKGFIKNHDNWIVFSEHQKKIAVSYLSDAMSMLGYKY